MKALHPLLGSNECFICGCMLFFVYKLVMVEFYGFSKADHFLLR